MKPFFFIAACGFLFACNQQGSNNTQTTDSIKQDNTQQKDTVPVLADTLHPTTITPPQGIYQATINKNGKKLQHTITFYTNNSYRLQEDQNGKVITNTSGRFTTTGNNIQLQQSNVYYVWKDRMLTLMYNGGQNALQKMMSARENKVWAAKEKEGIAFYGVGNEPFWNITVDEQKGIFFRLADWKEAVRFQPVKPVTKKDSTVYNSVNDTARLQVIIYNVFCSDGMSDYTYDQQVKVVYNGKVFKGCGISYGN